MQTIIRSRRLIEVVDRTIDTLVSVPGGGKKTLDNRIAYIKEMPDERDKITLDSVIGLLELSEERVRQQHRVIEKYQEIDRRKLTAMHSFERRISRSREDMDIFNSLWASMSVSIFFDPMSVLLSTLIGFTFFGVYIHGTFTK